MYVVQLFCEKITDTCCMNFEYYEIVDRQMGYREDCKRTEILKFEDMQWSITHPWCVCLKMKLGIVMLLCEP